MTSGRCCKTFYGRNWSTTTHSITTFSITRFSITTFSINVGILCFESEVFNFLFSNFSFKRLVLSYFTVVSLIPCSFNNTSDTRETYLATMN